MSDNPLKDMLFERIHTKIVQDDIHAQDYTNLVKHVIPYCMGMAKDIATYKEAAVSVSTGLLHYMLTVSATPSQRKMQYDKIDIDIILPHIRQLKADPSLALIVQVCPDCHIAKQRFSDTVCVQPVHKNIWLLTPDMCHREYTNYAMFDGSPSFSDLLRDVIRFSRRHGQNKLGLVG